MRVLYVTNDFPYPLTSGHLRHYFLLRELSRRHRITLLSIARPSLSDGDRAALAPFTERILTFTSSTQGRSRAHKVRNQLAAFATRRPVDRAALELARAAAALVRTEAPDVALVSGRRTLPVLAALGDLPVIADLCDADSERLRGTLRAAGLLARPRLALEYRRTVRAERALVERASHLLFASERDRQALAGRGPTPATVVPNGVDTEYWQRTVPRRGGGTLVFTGAMAYQPNTDAALQLVHEVLPLVRRSRPDARLLIVGRDPPERLRAAAAVPGVTVTGEVPDVRPWLEQASVFVAPLRFGAGIQNKVLEALAMELPVIASPLAAAGLARADAPPPPLEVADGAEATAAAVLRQLEARDREPAPFAAGRAHVTRYFGWRSSGEALERVLEDVASGRETRPELLQAG